MLRQIELFGLIDYLKIVLQHKEYSYLNSEPFETIFISYTGEPIISELDSHLTNGNYAEALSVIQLYEDENPKMLKVFETIKQDYFALEPMHSFEDIAGIFEEKYGIPEGEELVALLNMQSKFIEEHEYS